MKKVIAAIGFLFALNALVSADVILPNTHPVQLCAKIVDLEGFPDIVVIGYIRTISGGSDRYVVKQDSCLTKGYKFNGFYLLWTTKSYFDSIGLAQLPLDDFVKGLAKKAASITESPIHLLSASIAVYGGTVPDSNKLQSVQESYILLANGSNISLFLIQRKSDFSDNTENFEEFTPLRTVKPSQGMAVRNNTIENIFIRNGIFTFKTEFTGKLELLIIDCKGSTMQKQVKWCVPGYTYVANFANVKSGVYWLRLKSPNVETTKQLTIMR
jgi:hypothetical protein